MRRPQHPPDRPSSSRWASTEGCCSCASRRSGHLQPHLPGHTAGGGAGQRALRRGPVAQVLAQASLAGGGEADRGRATSPCRPRPAPRWATAAEARPGHAVAGAAAATADPQIRRELAVMPCPTCADQAPRPSALEAERRRQLVELLAEIEKRINDENVRPKKRYVSPATREEVVYALLLRPAAPQDRRARHAQLPRVPRPQALWRADHEPAPSTTVAAWWMSRWSSPPAMRRLDQRAIGHRAGAPAPFGYFSAEMPRQADRDPGDHPHASASPATKAPWPPR